MLTFRTFRNVLGPHIWGPGTVKHFLQLCTSAAADSTAAAGPHPTLNIYIFSTYKWSDISTLFVEQIRWYNDPPEWICPDFYLNFSLPDVPGIQEKQIKEKNK